MRKLMRSCGLLVSFLLLCASAAFAQAPAQPLDWPKRPVRIVVPTAAGGGTDVLARIVAERLSAKFGQPFLIDNKPGAGTTIGTAFVAKAPADGYTFLFTTNTHVILVAFHKTLPYDALRDFAPVSLVARSPLLMVVNSDLPVKSVKEFVEYAKQRPSQLSYASAGPGSPHHIGPAMLELATGIKLTQVVYKSMGELTTALLGNHITMSLAAVNGVASFVRDGRLRALAVVGETRSSLFPELPTLAEALGIPGVSTDLWYGMFAPAGTPPALIEAVNAEVSALMQDPAMQRTRFLPQGWVGVGSTSTQFGDIVRTEIPKYQRFVRDAKIPLQD